MSIQRTPSPDGRRQDAYGTEKQNTADVRQEPNSANQSSSDLERDVDSLSQPEPYSHVSNKKRILVLLGSSLIQLPIWGFAMCYGVIEEYYHFNWTFQGNQAVTGVIGTTVNGVMYLSMPILFALFTKRWARWRQTAALVGAVLACVSFILSAFSRHVWQLVVTQGVVQALGCALLFSPTTLSLGEWYNDSGRSVAYGISLSCKNIVGSVVPFLFRALLDKYGFCLTMIIWSAITLVSSIVAILMIPTHPKSLLRGPDRKPQPIPWTFLKHERFWIFMIAVVLQSAGYGLPQTYVSTYAREVLALPQTIATLLIALLYIPAIVATTFFGWLCDNKRLHLTAGTNTALAAFSSGLAVFLLWGLASPQCRALVVLFAAVYGFFGAGYSGTWGSILNELEKEAAQKAEKIDMGMIYGLLNGARGLGYVTGGLIGVPLFKAGDSISVGNFAYGTEYGLLIVFSGVCSALGGLGLFWNWSKLLRCKK